MDRVCNIKGCFELCNGKHYQCRVHRRETEARYRDKLRRETFDHYGNQCAICGATNGLQIDHIGGGGNIERRELKIPSGWHFYVYLRKNDYPEGYRSLCMACNAIAHLMSDNQIKQHYIDAVERINNARVME